MTCNIDGARLYSTYVVGKAGGHKGPHTAPHCTPSPRWRSLAITNVDGLFLYRCTREFAMPHLKLDQGLKDEARALAQHIVNPVVDYIHKHTTVAIERATLRLIGVDGVDEEGVPLPNRVVEAALPLLPGGILRPFTAAMLRSKQDVQATTGAIGKRRAPD